MTISCPLGTTLRSGSDTISNTRCVNGDEREEHGDDREHRLHEPRPQLEKVRHERPFRELLLFRLVVVGLIASSGARGLVRGRAPLAGLGSAGAMQPAGVEARVPTRSRTSASENCSARAVGGADGSGVRRFRLRRLTRTAAAVSVAGFR